MQSGGILQGASCGCCVQLANVLSTEQLFYACIIPFIIFFGSFAFFMYPLRDVLHPTGAPPSPAHCCLGSLFSSPNVGS